LRLGNLVYISTACCRTSQEGLDVDSHFEEVARKLGGSSVLGAAIRSQADLAQAVRNRLPLSALKGLSQAGLSEHEIEMFVIPQRTRRHRAEKRQPLTVANPIARSASCVSRRWPKTHLATRRKQVAGFGVR
jgi:hypothetical protein